ncbi:NACAD protein, partial [Thryothorus ludovicianus]|nr:NACAD protein [Thryothorus ludovicianus]
MPAKEEARPPPEGASCDPGPAAAAPPGSPCRPPPADPLDTRIVMGEETRCPPPEPRGGPPLFFTAPSTPVRAGGARPPPPEEPTDGDSEGLCSPPTSPSGSYMTAEGGSWGSSGTASTSPSCSPNLAAEAEGLGEAEGEPEGLGGALVLPPGLGDPPAFPPLSPEEEDDEDDDDDDEGPFAPPGCADDEDDEDGQTPEEDEDEDEGSGLIPAALLPFRGSLLFQAEAVEISPRAPAEEEEEEDEGSTSASFLRSLSESSIPEGGDEAFAFRDDTDASSDSAAYDGDEDERLYGTERHAGDTGTPPGTPPPPPDAAGVELHLRAGSPCHPAGQDTAPGSSGTPLAPPGGGAELDGDAFVTIAGAWPPPEPPEEVVAATEGSGAALGQGPSPEVAVTDPVPQAPVLCAGEPQSHQLGGTNGEPQDGPGGDSDGDNDLELSTGTVGSADGHSELDPAATNLGASVTPTPLDEMDTVANDVVA